MSTSEIVVVGAGPTGLTLACELHRQGVPCRVIERAAASTDLSRAIGVSTRTLEILDELGVADEAVERGHPIPRATFYSPSGEIGQVSTGSMTGTRFPFTLALPQPETEEILERRLEALGGRVEREVTLQGLETGGATGPVRLTLDGPDGEETVEAGWVVGADGSHSTVRKLAGIPFSGKAIGVTFVIVDAHVDTGPSRGAGHYHFSPDGMLVVVPLPDGAYRIAATTDPKAGAGDALSLADVQGLVTKRAPYPIALGELRNAGWGAARVEIQTRIAERFRAGRCLLAGDAAHIYSPVGGQGMNGGVQDAHNLAFKLALVSTGRAEEALLDTYDAERRVVSHKIQKATTAQTRMATVGLKPLAALRDRFIGRASGKGLLDRKMAPQIAGIDLDYKGSPGIAAGPKRGPQGRRIADTPLDGPAGSPATLHELTRGAPFTALVLGPADASGEVDATAASIESRYGDLVAVHRLWPSGAPAGALGDRGGDLHGRLEVTEPSVCLVRADHHVAHLGPASSSPALLALLERTIGTPATPAAGQRGTAHA